MSKALKLIIAILLASLQGFSSMQAFAQEKFDTAAPYAILTNAVTGEVFFEKSADTQLDPASMAKLMTIAVVLSEIEQGNISTSDEFPISEHAWRTGGAPSRSTSMLAELKSRVSVENLLLSVVVQNGNDASIALAEGIAETEPNFVEKMNAYAAKLGLTNTQFANATGLYHPDAHTSVRDLAILAQHLINHFPQYYPNFATPEFTWNKIRQLNKNDALNTVKGIDGLKTGSSEVNGHGIVTSSTEGNFRLIGVVHGLPTTAARKADIQTMLSWGATDFTNVAAYSEGQNITKVDVFGGTNKTVEVYTKVAVEAYISKSNVSCLHASITYKSPVFAPIEEGAQLAEVSLFCDERLVQQSPLFAAHSVDEGALWQKAADTVKSYLYRLIQRQ